MLYEFAGFRLDPARVELSRAGTPLALQPQVFSLLLLLVESILPLQMLLLLDL